MTAFSLLVCLFGFVALKASGHESLWEDYLQVFDGRLPTTFRSPYILDGAHLHAVKQSTINQFACATYADGEDFAFRTQHEEWHDSIKVISVDHEKDRMCFLNINKEKELSEFGVNFDFVLPLQTSLKVHDSLTKLMEVFNGKIIWPDVLPQDLMVYYLNQSFNSSDEGIKHFNHVVQSLTEYSLTPYENFFWTSLFAKDLFKNAPSDVIDTLEFKTDKERFSVWMEFAGLFKEKVIAFKSTDPCGFKNAIVGVAIDQSQVVYPVEHIMNMEDKTLSRVCLSYLTAAFAQEQSVNHVALTFRPQLFNFRARSIQQSATVSSSLGASPYTNAGLRGDGQVVSIADTGLDLNSCYFYDSQGHVPYSNLATPLTDNKYRKVIQYTYWTYSDTWDEVGGHGTHVSGTAAGSINGADISSDGQYDGVAPNAKIAFMDLGTPGSGLGIPPLVELYGDGWSAGSRVHTNSWGSPFSGSQYYCSHNVDELLNNNQNALIFFAAGNFGTTGERSISTDSSGKNVVAVGSSETTLGSANIDYMAWYSSRGPVYDGRIKPDLAAPGDQLMSAKSNGQGGQSCDTLSMTGTSMASPAAAGSALLVRQYFMDTGNRFWTAKCRKIYRSCKVFTPSGVLTKAVLLHSGSAMTMYDGDKDSDNVALGATPDNYQGWGRITLKNVLPLQGTNNFDLFVDDAVSIGANSEKSYAVRLGATDPVVPIKVTLSWYDPPNVDGTTSKALIHDLDLKVKSPYGDVYLGNGKNSADTVNNNEQVIINNPRKGTYQVTVNSKALPAGGTQLYSIVITCGGKSIKVSQKAHFGVKSATDYSIYSISPLIINNDDVITVRFNSTMPSSSDWIGAYSPPDTDITKSAPVKFGMCDGQSQSTYLTNGYGSLNFNMTNLRAGIKFYYFTGSLSTPIQVATSDQIVNFQNVNEPTQNRIVATGDQNVYSVLWSSANSALPVVQWGTSSGFYPNIATAVTSTIDKSSLCGPPATTTGWFDLGLIHTANITGVVDNGLSGQQIYYKFGDAATNDFSSEVTFLAPPLPGTQPPLRPTQVVLMADLGVGSTDTSYDTKIWKEACPPAINTTMSISALVDQGLVDAVFHSGDISYADGYLASWEFYLDMISPFAGRVTYLTTVGNHESDYYNAPNTNYKMYNTSGGECDVTPLSLIPQPNPATINEPWWSYDIGIIHFVGMSSEHNYTTYSKQLKWIENDLKNVNRTKTPWVIFSTHRSMYVDSDECCQNYDDDNCLQCVPGSDVNVMDTLQQYVEPLLYKYQVNLAFAGHFHDLERQSAVYKDKVVQAAEYVLDSEGHTVAYHASPQATVWMITGSAGNGPSIATMNYSWSERYWDNVFGYALVTAVNATVLNWQTINSANNAVIDRMTLTQTIGAVWAENAQSDSSSSSSGFYALSYGAQVAIITIGTGVAVLLFIILWIKVIMPYLMKLVSHDPDQARILRKDIMREGELA